MFKTHFLVLILVFPFTSSQAPSFAASAKLSETQAIVFGGITSKGASNSLFLVEANSIQEIDFKTSNDIWTPLPTFKHCCAILDGILHCFGGVDSLAYVYRFDTATLSWISPLSSFLTPRIGHSCSIDNTGFHVYGGRYSNNTLDTFSFANTSWSSSSLSARFDSSLVSITSIPGTVALFFGIDSLNTTARPPLFVQGSTSALINSINIPQISTGASCVDYSTSSPRVLCFGGIIDSINTNSINQVDLASNSLDALATWSILGTSGFPPSPRSNSIFIRLGNTLIVWGGIFNGVSTSDSLFYTFDLTSNTWQAPIAAKINQTVSNINIPAIVGGTVGGLILLILVILCLYYKRNRDRKQSVVKEDRKRYDLFIKNNPASEFYNQLRQSLSRKRNSTNSDGFISQLRRTLSRSKDKEVEEGESKRYSIYGLLGMSNKDGIPDVPNKRISVMSSTKSIVTNADLESHISAEKVQYKHHKETKTVEMVYPSTIDYHKSFSFPISKSLDRSLEPAIANENANLEDMEKSPASRLDDSKLKKASTVPNSTTETSQPPSLNEINVSPESVSTEIEQVKPVSNIEKQNFVAIYKFEPIVNIDSFEIPLSVGDLVYIKEEYDDGWVYGVNLSQRNMAGFVPKDFLRKLVMKKSSKKPGPAAKLHFLPSVPERFSSLERRVRE